MQELSIFVRKVLEIGIAHFLFALDFLQIFNNRVPRLRLKIFNVISAFRPKLPQPIALLIENLLKLTRPICPKYLVYSHYRQSQKVHPIIYRVEFSRNPIIKKGVPSKNVIP